MSADDARSVADRAREAVHDYGDWIEGREDGSQEALATLLAARAICLELRALGLALASLTVTAYTVQP